MERLGTLAARGGSVMIVSQLLTVVLRVVALIVLARLIAPEIFGLLAVAIAFTSFATALLYLGIPTAVVQADHVSKRTTSSFFLINLAVGGLLSLGLLACAPMLAEVYEEPDLAVPLMWFASVPVITALGVQSGVQLQRSLRFTGLAAIEFASFAVGTAAAVSVAVVGDPVVALISQQLVPPILKTIGLLVLAKWLPGRPGDLDAVRSLLRIGVRIFGMNVLRSASRNVVVPAAGFVATPAAVGNLDRAQHLVISPIHLTVDQLQRVAIPVLSRLRDQPARMLRYMQHAQLLAAYGTGSAFLLLAALGEPLVTVLLGADWERAGVLVQWLAVGGCFRVLGQTMQWLFISCGATRAGLRFNLWAQPAIAAITLCGLPWGVLGVAVANTIAWILHWPVATFAASRAAAFSRGALIVAPARAFVAWGAPAALAAVAVRAAGWPDGPTVCAGLAAALVVMGLSVLLLRPVRRDIRAIISTMSLMRRQGHGVQSAM